MGTFSGTLVDGAKATRMAVYTDQSLFPGWQVDPTRAGNAVTMKVSYFFDPSHTTPDRVETYQNAALNVGDAFFYENKITEFYFDQVFGLKLGTAGPNPNPVHITGASFPAVINNGIIVLHVYGGSVGTFKKQVPVSIDAAILTNRASWIKAPYTPFEF